MYVPLTDAQVNAAIAAITGYELDYCQDWSAAARLWGWTACESSEFWRYFILAFERNPNACQYRDIEAIFSLHSPGDHARAFLEASEKTPDYL